MELYYTIEGHGMFGAHEKKLEHEIPNTMMIIESKTFYYHKKLISITIRDSITEILDSSSFDCLQLKSVIIPVLVVSFGNNSF